MEDYNEEIYFSIIGAAESGKTSLANALLGKNDFRDDNYLAALDLFDAVVSNEYEYKNGYMLGEKD